MPKATPTQLEEIQAEYQKGLEMLQKVGRELKERKLQEDSWIDMEVKKATEDLEKLKTKTIKQARPDQPFRAPLQTFRAKLAAKMVELIYDKGKQIIARGKLRAGIILNDTESEQWKIIERETEEAREQLKKLAQVTVDQIGKNQPFDTQLGALDLFMEKEEMIAQQRLELLKKLAESQPEPAYIPHRQAYNKTEKRDADVDEEKESSEEVKREASVGSQAEDLLKQVEKSLLFLIQLNGQGRLLPNTVDSVIDEAENKLKNIKASDDLVSHQNALERMKVELAIYTTVTKIKVIAQELAGYYSDNPVEKEKYLKIVKEMREQRRVIRVDSSASNQKLTEATTRLEEQFKLLEVERDKIASDKFELQQMSTKLSDGYDQLAKMLKGEFRQRYAERAVDIKKKWDAYLSNPLTYKAIQFRLGHLREDFSRFNQRMAGVGEIQETVEQLCKKLTQDKAANIRAGLDNFLNQYPFPSIAEMTIYKANLEAQIKKLDHPLTNSGVNLFTSRAPMAAQPSVLEPEPRVSVHLARKRSDSK